MPTPVAQGHASWLARLAAAVPSRCAICGAWPAQPLCRGCIARFARAVPRCRTCALPVPAGVAACGHCVRRPPPLDACLAAVDYAWPWSALIGRFKFEDEPAWALHLAALLREAAGVPEALAAADLVIPVPLAPARLAGRGYNQALELARALAPRKARAGLLRRVRETAPQAELDLARRQANVRGAFAVEPGKQEAVAGRSVLLVDDVMTSGASLFAAAEALRAAGAARVAAVVVARTPAPA